MTVKQAFDIVLDATAPRMQSHVEAIKLLDRWRETIPDFLDFLQEMKAKLVHGGAGNTGPGNLAMWIYLTQRIDDVHEALKGEGHKTILEVVEEMREQEPPWYCHYCRCENKSLMGFCEQCGARRVLLTIQAMLQEIKE